MLPVFRPAEIAALLSLCCLTLLVEAAAADDVAYTAKQVQTLLSRYCVDCHSADYAESGFRLDDLADADGLDWSDEAVHRRLVKAHDRLVSGEMPPKDADSPGHAAREAAGELLARELNAADRERQLTEGRTRRRRLTRTEYEHAVHDLLKIDTPIKGMLPGDAVAHGFDKTADALGLSSVLMQQYLAASAAAVESAIELAERPEQTTVRISPIEAVRQPPEKHDSVKNFRSEKLFKLLDDAVAIFPSGYCPSELRQSQTKHAGRYRVTIDAYAYRNEGEAEPLRYRLYAGQFFKKDGQKRLVGFYEAQPSDRAKPLTIEIDLPKDAMLKPVPWDTGHRIYKEGAAESTETALALRSVTIEGPLTDQWPPASHRVVFGDLPVKPNPRVKQWRYRNEPPGEVVSATPEADARRLLTRFAARAFRRPEALVDAEPFVQLVMARLADGVPFTEALPIGYQAILCDPMFLTVGCDAGQERLSPHALASRLSLFLWGSTPDEELTALADSGAISDPDVRREQVRRMLADPRRERFIADLGDQWLDLAWIDASTPDPELFPEYDELLRESMVTETLTTLRHLFDENRPIRETVDADYAFLDRRLATHYGLDPDALGLPLVGFERVALPKGSLRGGFLTQAAVAKVTANGTHTSPVYRGSWVLDAILGQPAPPPPPNVPAVEPDVRGAKTIRDLLAKHREDQACAVCHDRLDPAGFAMEELDVIGRQRTVYRVPREAANAKLPGIVRGSGTIGNREIRYAENTENRVDSSGTLPSGESFADLREFKRLIAADDRQLARAMAEKLLVYGTGEGASFCDREAIERIVDAAEASEFGLRTLLEEVVASETFARR